MTIAPSHRFKWRPKNKAVQIEAANFTHLYWDVAWFGVAFGSTLSFLAIFITRLGAAGWQVGLLSAGPALISVLFALPAGRWLENRSLGPAVTRAAIWHRLGYLILIPLPLLFSDSTQIWLILALVLAMAVPGSALTIGFNALLAATVPPDKRGTVVGRRNALLSATIMVAFLFSGWLLDTLSFTWGYAFVFGLGAVGSVMSTYHLYHLRVPETPRFEIRPLKDSAIPGRAVGFGMGMFQRLGIGSRLWLTWRPGNFKSLAQISPQYWWMMVAFLLFHFTQFLPGALYPLFFVNELQLSDGQISWINAVYYLTMLVVAPFLGALTQRFGNYRLTAWGAILLGLYPLLIALSSGLVLLMAASVVIGLIWAIMSGTLVNRLLESIPEESRPTHLAIYNVALNVATLTGTMLGPVLAEITGLREAFLIAAAVRFLSGFAVARWG